MIAKLGSIRRDRRGNVAMMLALAAPVLLMLAGLSVDFAFKMNAKALLQQSLDSALLAAARSGADSLSEKQEIALQFATSNLAGRYDADTLTLTVSENPETGELIGLANVTVPNFFGGFFGAMSGDVGARSAVRADSPPLEVIFVLDKTGSMAGAKMTALKSAATDLVEQLMDGEIVRVGIVPFARYVNIGMGLRNEPGFDVPADGQSCSMQNVPTYSNPHNCTPVPVGTCYNDGVAYQCGGGQSCQYDVTYQQQNVCNDIQWHGCVGSRDEPLNERDDDTATPVPGLMNVWCGGNAITRLTNDKGTVTDAINELTAEDQTYIPAGLMMGWHALSHRPILPDGTDPSTIQGSVVNRAIVLMTDGANTASKDNNAATHWSGDVNSANNLTRDLCRNIKQDGVTVYTIAFDVDDPQIEAILRQCATAPDHAFDAANAAELSGAFQAVGNSLSRLRLSR
jgi:Flp pilus assembly protein TadG